MTKGEYDYSKSQQVQEVGRANAGLKSDLDRFSGLLGVVRLMKPEEITADLREEMEQLAARIPGDKLRLALNLAKLNSDFTSTDYRRAHVAQKMSLPPGVASHFGNVYKKHGMKAPWKR